MLLGSILPRMLHNLTVVGEEGRRNGEAMSGSDSHPGVTHAKSSLWMCVERMVETAEVALASVTFRIIKMICQCNYGGQWWVLCQHQSIFTSYFQLKVGTFKVKKQADELCLEWLWSKKRFCKRAEKVYAQRGAHLTKVLYGTFLKSFKELANDVGGNLFCAKCVGNFFEPRQACKGTFSPG